MINRKVLLLFCRESSMHLKTTFILRHEFKDLVEIMAYDSSSSESSSEDEDMDLLVYYIAFPLKLPCQMHVSLDNFSKLEREQLFR